MENKKIRISEAEYDAVCEYRKSLGKSFVPKEQLKRGNRKSYRTRLCDEEQKIVDKIRKGEPTNTDEEHSTKKSIRNILVIGDLHAPFTKFGYLDFCKSIYHKYKCTDVIFIGDLLDNHVASFHETDPDGMGGREELYKAKEQIAEFYKAFPIARVVIGNHDKLPNRKAFSSGLSSSWIKTIDEVLNVPNWEFEEEFVIDNVLYTHGEGRQARIRVMQELISVVQGHWHAKTYYETFTSERKFVFALQIGCGIDRKSYAAAYAKHFQKPQINVGVVLDNGRYAVIEHMKM